MSARTTLLLAVGKVEKRKDETETTTKAANMIYPTTI